jgi:hypothetical protein
MDEVSKRTKMKKSYDFSEVHARIPRSQKDERFLGF